MKKLYALPFILILSFCLFNFNFADVYSSFGSGSKEVEQALFSAIQSNKLYIPYLSNAVKTSCKAISAENQAAAVARIGELFKAYYASDDFKARYNQWVSSTFPETNATVSKKRRDEILAERMREVQNLTAAELSPTVDMQIQLGASYTEMEKMLASLPAEQRDALKKQIETGQRNTAFFLKLKPILKSDFLEAKRQYASFLAEDQIAQEESTLAARAKNNMLELSKWKDPNKVLKTKLTEFLALTEDIDFAAQTKLESNKQRFVNSAYEKKNVAWKFCFRMGKTPTNAARNFAKSWLASL